jgi:transposase
MIGTEGPDTEVETILGVDTHLDFHLAVALDHLGRRLGELSVPTTAKGYERLLRWAERFGPLGCAGVEGTSSYGAGLARHLGAKGIEVLEVERPRASAAKLAPQPREVRPPPTPKPPHERSWPARRRACPRAQTAMWR